MLEQAEDATTEAVAREEGEVPCLYVSGRAGTGKTFWCKQQIAADPGWGLLCATTGIAAVNLDATTINSQLAYFDTDSLRDNYLQGGLTRKLHELALQHRRLVIDEVSMMAAEQLDLIYRALSEANGYRDIKEPMGLVLVGDFAQLPPIKARWAFDATCWPAFAANTTRLTKIYRQDQLEFLDALDAARRGDGERAAGILTSVGVQWHTERSLAFPGTTIVAKNDDVDRHNNLMLDRMPGPLINVTSRRWGKGAADAKWKNVPERLQLKLGAYVMILSNENVEWRWVNGDCGTIVGNEGSQFQVRLVRNGEVVSIPKLVRSQTQKDKPANFHGGREEGYCARPHRDGKGRYVTGQVEYFPLRLAYASTVHKSQGLSLDAVQIDLRQGFMSSPAMAYVALSRCRTLQGLRLVGQPEVLGRHCHADPRVREWL